MDTETLTKINKLITGAKHIAIVLPQNLNIDNLCAGLALHHKLTVIDGKQSMLFSSAKNIPTLDFIVQTPSIYSNFGSNQELTIKVSGERVKPKQLRYEKKGDDLYVYIAHQDEVNQFSETDVEVFPASSSFDLIIILGSETLESIGSLYDSNPEAFYNTQKIAINNKIEQEYYATVTWVESDVPSLSQQLAQWFAQDEQVFKNDFIITNLLAGIISATQSFSNPRTTPETLSVAAKLVGNGARRQDVIKYLYKTKPFNLLQLWGRALARIKTFQNDSVLYTVVTTQDFLKSQTGPDLLPQVVSEIISMANNYKLIILAAEVEGGLDLIFAAPPHIKIKQLAKSIDPTFTGQSEVLVSNYQYLRMNLPNFKLEDLEQVVSTLSASSI